MKLRVCVAASGPRSFDQSLHVRVGLEGVNGAGRADNLRHRESDDAKVRADVQCGVTLFQQSAAKPSYLSVVIARVIDALAHSVAERNEHWPARPFAPNILRVIAREQAQRPGVDQAKVSAVKRVHTTDFLKYLGTISEVAGFRHPIVAISLPYKSPHIAAARNMLKRERRAPLRVVRGSV